MLHENRHLYNRHQLLARQGNGPNENEEDEEENDKGPKNPLKDIIPDIPGLPPLDTRKPRPPRTRTTVTPLDPKTILPTPPVIPVPQDTTSVTPIVLSTPPITLSSPTILPSPSAKTSPSPVQPGTTTLTVTSHKSSSVPTQSSTTKTAQTSGAANTGALAGGIGGGIAGAALLGVLVFFLVRRYRRKSLQALTFDAPNFRKSALLLDDPPAPPVKEPQYQNRNAAQPRPPSMIERHMHAPAVPQTSASNPYAAHATYSVDPYAQYTTSANQYNSGMYGADGQVARDPYGEMYGGNVSGTAFGQHARYGQQDAYGAPRTQMYQPYHDEQHFQPSFSPGQILPSSRPPANDAHPPHPFSNTAVSASSAIAAARSAASAGSLVPSPESTTTATSGGGAAPSYVNRLPTQNGSSLPAHEHQAQYMHVQRDVKMTPGTLTAVNGDDKDDKVKGAVDGKQQHQQQQQRPSSIYTVYDLDDVYGGMT